MTKNTEKKREQIVLIVGILIFLTVSYSAFFLFPTLKSIDKAKKQLTQYRKNKQELKNILQEYRKYAVEEKREFEGNLSDFISKKAQRSQIQLVSLRPFDNNRAVEIKMEDLPPDKLVRFLYDMERGGITVTQMNMTDYKGTNRWSVKVFLKV